MDETTSGNGSEGFKQRWHEQSIRKRMANLGESTIDDSDAGLARPKTSRRLSSPGASVDLDTPDEPIGLDGLIEHFNVDLQSSDGNVDDPLNLFGAASSVVPSPSPLDDVVVVDHGGRSSKEDDEALISDLYITGISNNRIVMPWETSMMKPIFGDAVVQPSLSMPLDWGSTVIPRASEGDVSASVTKIPPSTVWACAKHVCHATDESYLQQREKTLKTATAKWFFLLRLKPECSEVGSLLTVEDDPGLVLRSVIGVKSPSTVIKRANSILLFYRWHAVNGDHEFLPFNESDVWKYVLQQGADKSSATRSHAFVQALRFCHYVMGFEGALTCANSRRIVGQSHLQLAEKKPTRQARPLTVFEMKRLHSVAEDLAFSAVDRCIASSLLAAIYGRCRVSDLSHVHEILHDQSGSSGFMEISTRYHKTARNAQQKSMLLPIVISNAGLSDVGWIETFVANRKEAGLPVSGLVDGAFIPAPAIGDKASWCKRPLSTMELTNILRDFLMSEDETLSSHSMKATMLSWSAKAELPREYRRILGRHSSVIADSDSVYSRDLSFGPVNALKKVIHMVKDGSFNPDSSRANYFPHAHPSTPVHAVMQPFTPAFQRLSGAAVLTPVPGEADCCFSPTEAVIGDELVEPKDENDWNFIEAEHGEGPILVESDTDSDSSASGDEVDETDDETPAMEGDAFEAPNEVQPAFTQEYKDQSGAWMQGEGLSWHMFWQCFSWGHGWQRHMLWENHWWEIRACYGTAWMDIPMQSLLQR